MRGTRTHQFGIAARAKRTGHDRDQLSDSMIVNLDVARSPLPRGPEAEVAIIDLRGRYRTIRGVLERMRGHKAFGASR